MGLNRRQFLATGVGLAATTAIPDASIGVGTDETAITTATIDRNTVRATDEDLKAIQSHVDRATYLALFDRAVDHCIVDPTSMRDDLPDSTILFVSLEHWREAIAECTGKIECSVLNNALTQAQS